MKIFLSRLFIFIAIPIILLLFGYVCFDPFKVIFNYDDYTESRVVLNTDYVSTQYYLNRKDKYHYNSFLFGSSRTMGFNAKHWGEYIGNGAVPCVFVGAGETLYGIESKLKFLDRNNIKIDNVLIILCRDWCFAKKTDYKEHIFIKHPDVVRSSWFYFHSRFISAYFNPKFLLAFYNYKVTNTFQESMRFIISESKLIVDPVTNQGYAKETEDKIKKNTKKFYAEKDSIFYKRTGETTDTINRIDDDYIIMLKNIKRILVKNEVNYKIIAGPLYDQIKFTEHDKKILIELFGANIYDYTGKNKFTQYKENYYETSHFRPHVGDQILKEIYLEKNKNAIMK